jgi:hypothetical protein
VGERGEMEEKKSYVISEFVRLRHKLITNTLNFANQMKSQSEPKMMYICTVITNCQTIV